MTELRPLSTDYRVTDRGKSAGGRRNDPHHPSKASNKREQMSPTSLKKSSPFGLSGAMTGGHLGRSMMLVEMTTLVRSLAADAGKETIVNAIQQENVLEKPTQSSRVKSLRHLIQLYGLDPSQAAFRVLWHFGHEDIDSLPQLCLVSAYARDPQFRQSFELIRTLRPGALLEPATMEAHLETGFPGRFSLAMKKSLAQNVSTSWTDRPRYSWTS